MKVPSCGLFLTKWAPPGEGSVGKMGAGAVVEAATRRVKATS